MSSQSNQNNFPNAAEACGRSEEDSLSQRSVLKLSVCQFCGSKIRLEKFEGRLQVLVADEVIADSTRAILFREAERPPAVYFPPEDVRVDLLQPTDLQTVCYYKGDASYWSIHTGERVIENAVWSYKDASEDSVAIRGYLSFYWNKVDGWLKDGEPFEDRLQSLYAI
ncbi:DUF427 domain-containing protein [Paenibacillus sp. GCM10012306]|uniref:DUF427 domain-containing protein n=1 Tax=Paenibacillus sp. GCM10012306 TaxID=3317342 RepID=UPI0036160716